MVRYRTVFEDLLTDGADDDRHDDADRDRDHHDRRNGHDHAGHDGDHTDRRDAETRDDDRHETRKTDVSPETGQHERQASAQPRTEWNGGR
jgi:hypothetical protein